MSLHCVGNNGAPEIGGVAPAGYVAVTGRVVGEGIPELIWLSGGIEVPTGVVGPVEVDEREVEVELKEEVEVEVEVELEEVEVVDENCLFARRA